MAKTASVTLRGRFPAGTKVELRERRSDVFSLASKVVKTATVKRDGTATFTGFEEGERLWIAAEVDGVVRSAMVTAKCAPEPKKRVDRPSAAEARPSQREHGPFKDRPKKSPRELSERVHQRDVPADVVQRSATPLGMATPKDPGEVAPGLRQEDVPKGVVQRSDTPRGFATVKPEGDESPAVSQESVKGRQRSDTRRGAAAPKPRAARARTAAAKRRAALKAAKDRDAERSQKALRDGAQKATGGRTAAQRSAASKKAAATRRRNAARGRA